MTPAPISVKLATKAARHQRIITLLEHDEVVSQAQILDLLAADGIEVTQATLSRDLDELRAVKVKASSGAMVYAVPSDGGDPAPVMQSADSARTRLERVVAELLSSADHSGNIVVLRTPPGAAQYLASAIDHTTMSEVLGTVAGDDTVMVVSKDPRGGAKVAAQFTQMAIRRGSVALVANRSRSANSSKSVEEKL